MRQFILWSFLFTAFAVLLAGSPNSQANSDKAIAGATEGITEFFHFMDDFEAYTAGTQLVVQNSTNWTTWSNSPGSGEDPFVSDNYAHSGSNSVVIVQNNDLVKVFSSAPITSGVWKMSFQVYIPDGKAGYFNTMSEVLVEWAMQVYFDAGGTGRLDAGAASAATFSYPYDTWMTVEVLVDLDNDMAEFWLDGSMIYSWQYTLGTFGTPIALQLDANNFFGATADDEMYIDDYRIEAVDFFDDFEAYTAGTQLVLQDSVNWTTWTASPGSGEDPMVSDAYAYSGSNSVVIVQNNDLVKTFGSLTSGVWQISFQVYIPDGKAGYFNTLSGFTPNPFEWGMEVYFDVGGGGRLNGGATNAATFSYAYDTWQSVEIIVDLDNDNAEFWFDGTMIHSWQWTLGSGGAGSQLQLDANDFFGATADDEMYLDDYRIAEVVPQFFMDNFDSYTAGTQLVVQNSTDWTTWSGTPGTGEDPFVTDVQSYSGANSVVIVQNNDLVKTHGQLTSGIWSISFYVYIPSGKAGYFNTLAGFTPNPFNWGMEAYFDAAGGGRLFAGSATAIPFNYSNDTWQLVEVIVDLDNDQAQFLFDGALIHTWQWTLGASGGTSPLQLDANDFFGATADDEMYMDDYKMGPGSIVVGLDGNEAQNPEEFALYQNYPNPFNPTTTIEYMLKENSEVSLNIFNILGQKVKTLVNVRQSAGLKQVTWDGTNDAGVKVASGIYIYLLKASNFTESRKMILLK